MSDDNKFTPKGEEEIKAEVIEKYDLDEETQSETIDKITADNLESQKKLGTAIRQKGEWRDKANANTPSETPPEGEAGGEKPKAETKTPEGKPNKSKNDISRDELVLIAKGMDENLIETAQMVADKKGIPLSEAIKDPLVEAVKEKNEREAKSTEAGLGASGSSTPKTEKTPLNTPDVSREDHKKAWEEANK